MSRRNILWSVLGGGVLVLTVVLTVFWASHTPPRAVLEPGRERVWAVQTVPFVYTDLRVSHQVYGTVIASNVTPIRSEIEAIIVEIPDTTKSAAVVSAGQLLYRLDAQASITVRTEAQASLAEVLARGRELRAVAESNRTILTADEEDMEAAGIELKRIERLRSENIVSAQALDEAKVNHNAMHRRLLERQRAVATDKAKIAANEAQKKRFAAALDRAQQNVEKAEIEAPFAGVLTEVSGARGQWVQRGERLAELTALTAPEIRLHIPNHILRAAAAVGESLIGRPLRFSLGEGQNFFTVIGRLEAQIDTHTGGIYAYASVPDTVPDVIRPGFYLELMLEGRFYEGVAEIPPHALFSENTIFAVDEHDRLKAYKVEIVARLLGRYLVRGDVPSQVQIVITPLAEIGPGLKVQPQPVEQN